MESVLKIMDLDSSIMEAGEVVDVDLDEQGFLVDTPFGYIRARKAEGCLITPVKGDKVLLYADSAENAYILSVLERNSKASSAREMAFDGPVEIVTKNGRLDIRSQQDIRILSSRDILINSEGLNLSARQGNFFIEQFRLLGNILTAKIKRIKTVADSVDSIFRRAVERLKSSYRYITGHEEVQARSTRTLVDETMVVQTKNTIHKAKENVKIDASQIHMG